MKKEIKIDYRLLNKSELENLDKDFVFFLSAQGIDASAWNTMKSTDQTSALNYIKLFSNFIFDNVLHKVEYLIRTKNHSFEAFHCQKNQIVRLILTSDSNDVDFMKIDLLNKSSYDDSYRLNISISQKKYSDRGRLADIFLLMENGCGISEGKLYKKLCLMV